MQRMWCRSACLDGVVVVAHAPEAPDDPVEGDAFVRRSMVLCWVSVLQMIQLLHMMMMMILLLPEQYSHSSPSSPSSLPIALSSLDPSMRAAPGTCKAIWIQ